MGLGLWSRRMCGPSATPPSSVGWIHDSLLEAKDYVVVVVVGRLSLDTSGDLTTDSAVVLPKRPSNCLASSQG